MADNLILNKIRTMDGENPHQAATLYAMENVPDCSLLKAEMICGRQLSFNDTIDTDAALALVREFSKEDGITAVLYHHGNPCGVAIDNSSSSAFSKVRKVSDATSVIEGILVINDVIDFDTAQEISQLYLNVVVALDFSTEAVEILRKQTQLTALKHPSMMAPILPNAKEVKSIAGGVLIQDYNNTLTDEIKTITSREAESEEMKQLLLAWKVVKHTKSNAIVLVRDNATVGIGPGANNRIWSTEQAIIRAGDKAKGSVLASDAIIPLSESIELAGQAGITAIIEPGGWYKENENIEVAEKYQMAIITTGINQFKH